MQPTHRFWSTLDQSPGQFNILPEWRRLLGSDFEVVSLLFRPTDYRAQSVSCPSPGGNGCPRRIVDHGDGEILAVCNDEEEGCDDIMLSSEDIIAHELDRRKLADMVARVLNIHPTFSPLDGFFQTIKVGDINPGGSRRFPVFLTIQLNTNALRDVTFRLFAKTREPFVLLTFTRDMIGLEMEDMLARNKSCFMALADILIRNDRTGDLVGVESAHELLSRFIREAAPELTDVDSMSHFPTPPGARWEHFTFEFLADSALLVRCKGVHQPRRLEPEHLGMKNLTNGAPNNQWLLLKIFALSGGHLSWESRHANPKLKNQKQILSRKLKRYFHIDKEPIPWNRQSRTWETLFVLRQYQPPQDDRAQTEYSIFEEALLS